VLVNPELLRAFANRVDTASDAVRGADIGTKAMTAADGLSGSTTQWAIRLIADDMARQAGSIAKNVNDMGVAVRGAGDKYEVEDSALAGAFDRLF
jgi:hypothetical protein